MSACEKCWTDAGGDAGKYASLLAEREAAGTVCSPEQQAGRDATDCPGCGRRAIHRYTGECTADCGWVATHEARDAE